MVLRAHYVGTGRNSFVRARNPRSADSTLVGTLVQRPFGGTFCTAPVPADWGR